MPESWQSIAKRKQADREARIPNEWKLSSVPSKDTVNVIDIPRTCGILTQDEIDITENYDATALAEAIAARALKCVDVTRAYCKRAAIAHQLTNCLTEIMFDSALRRAAYLDNHLDQYGKPLGPLHGVPISVKDTFRVASEDNSIGIAALAYKPSTSTAPLVSLLLSAGAVIHCKTNVPQTLMALDSINNVFGRTINPINNKLTAGGSSGGEGALVAMKGSALGVGTDVGGSIRIPAMCNGLYGIKPSANRVPYAGQEGGGVPGIAKLGVEASAGPITRTLRDCDLFLSAVAAGKPWLRDPSTIPGLWTNMDQGSQIEGVSKPLTIGILTTDGVTTPLPPIAQLIASVSEMLIKSGHRVHTITPPASFRTSQSIAGQIMSIEGANTVLDLLDAHKEPLIPVLSRLKRKPRATLLEAAALQAKREQLTTEMLALWTTSSGEGVDAIVCPLASHPVPPIDRWGAVGYTSTWVLLDCPAGTVPIRSFVEADLEGEMNGEPLNSWDKGSRGLWDKSKIDRKMYLGTPLSVQVVAPRLQEKRLYRAMEVVDMAAKMHLRPSQEKNSVVSSKAKL